MKLIHIETGNMIDADAAFLEAHKDEYAEYVPASVSVDTVRAERIDALHAAYQSFFDAYISQYPASEVATFEDKKNEAMAYMNDNAAPTPIIDSIVAGYGGDRLEYIDSIIQKVQYLAVIEGKMVSIRDSIKAATTVDEINAIDIMAFMA